MKEVFVARKLNRWGYKIGFVRFYDVKNVERLEKELDSIRIGDMKLYVNVPRYYKGQDSQRVAQNRRKPRALETVIAKPKLRQVWNAKEGAEKVNRGRPSGGEEESAWKGHSLKVPTVRPVWLVDSWVGTMRVYKRMEVLREEMMRLGLGSIRVRYLGDKAVLLTGQDGTQLKDIVTTNLSALAEVFEVIEPWSEKDLRGSKVVWTRCRVYRYNYGLLNALHKLLIM